MRRRRRRGGRDPRGRERRARPGRTRRRSRGSYTEWRIESQPCKQVREERGSKEERVYSPMMAWMERGRMMLGIRGRVEGGSSRRPPLRLCPFLELRISTSLLLQLSPPLPPFFPLFPSRCLKQALLLLRLPSLAPPSVNPSKLPSNRTRSRSLPSPFTPSLEKQPSSILQQTNQTSQHSTNS